MIGTDAQRAFLTDAFTNARAFAELGIVNLTPNQSPDGTQVFNWLFGTEGPDMMRDSVRVSLVGVSQNAEALPAEAEPRGGANADVVLNEACQLVYCTHNRLAKGNPRPDGSVRTFNKLTKQFLKAKYDCARALAWTIVPSREHRDNEPDEMQICPWFLDYGMEQHAQFQSQFSPGKMASMIEALKLDQLATWAVYTAVDLFQLFDKVIVHELTHTRRGNLLDDVGGFDGYGWKNCRKLSTARGGTDVPHKNADSVALFASISNLIRTGGMVNEDGTFRDGDGNNEGEGEEGAGDGGGGNNEEEGEEGEGNAAKRRSALVLGVDGGPVPLDGKRAPQFNAASLKGRPLF